MVKYVAELDLHQASIVTHQFFVSLEMSSITAFSSVPKAGSPFFIVTLEAVDDGKKLDLSFESGPYRAWGWHKFFERQ